MKWKIKAMVCNFENTKQSSTGRSETEWQGYFRKKYSGSLLSPLFGYFWAWLLFGYLLVISWLISC